MPTALIATALSLETEAVAAHLSLREELEHGQGSLYPNGVLDGPGDWEVVIAETGKGNARAGIEAARAIEFAKPCVALFVGIAGGVKDVTVGDVAVGERVYYVEGGKTTTTGEGEDADAVFRPRPEAVPGDYRLLHAARSLKRSGVWKDRVLGGPYDPAPLARAVVEIGPIAAGEKVIAAKHSDAFRLIKESYGDSIAVEMEGHGFGLGTHATGDTPSLVVRGISDVIDGKAGSDESGSQFVAAARAAAFAVALLGRYRPPGQNGSGIAAEASALEPADALDWGALRDIAAKLYPGGPMQRSVWERAGGDPAQLPQRDDGRTAWFEALKLVHLGGGGSDLSLGNLLAEMRKDFRHPALSAFGM